MATSIGEPFTASVSGGDRWAVFGVAIEPAAAGTRARHAGAGVDSDTATSITKGVTLFRHNSNRIATACVWNAGSAAPTGVTYAGDALTLQKTVTRVCMSRFLW